MILKQFNKDDDSELNYEEFLDYIKTLRFEDIHENKDLMYYLF